MLIILTVVLLLTCSALFSGLTLGLLSLNVHELRRKAELGDRLAGRVYPLRKEGNQLLVTLILGNIFVNTLLTVVLDEATNGFIAVVLGTVLIVLFGEIIPQATLGRYGLRFGARIAPVIEKLMWLFSPVARPLSRLLDRALGEEAQVMYSKDELVKIIEEHSLSDDSDVAHDELRIVEHALTFSDKPIDTVMTPRSMIRFVDASQKINLELLDDLHASGHSRFPVIVGDNEDEIVGTLYLRDLVERTGQVKVDSLMSKEVYYVSDTETLDHALNGFLKTKHHLFIVVNEFGETVGLVTIEDILEQILGRKIVDEFDKYDDLRAVAKKNAKN